MFNSTVDSEAAATLRYVYNQRQEVMTYEGLNAIKAFTSPRFYLRKSMIL